MQSQLKSISEDHICPVCLSLFLKPIYLQKCHHRLCQHCIDDIVILMNKNKCPLCRTVFSSNEIKKDEQLWAIIQRQYPVQIQQKMKGISERVMYRLAIGNTTQEVQTNEDNKYNWCLFIKPAEGQKPLKEYIDSIELRLHPTFNPSRIVYKVKNIDTINLKRLGWGTFNIEIVVIWKSQFEQKQTQFNHYLDFIPLKQAIQTTYLTKKKSK